jgi:carbamoyltransferase
MKASDISTRMLLAGAARLLDRRRRGPRTFPRMKASRVLGIASTGHGASLAYVDTRGVIRSSQLERWTGTKHTLLFSYAEEADVRDPRDRINRQINYSLSLGYGRFPHSRVFEETIEDWLEWLLRGLGVRSDDIDLVVTSDCHFATGWSRLGTRLDRWFPNARTTRVIEHHEIHQRQAFWPSGLAESAVLTLDTRGESLPRLGGRHLAGTISTMNQHGQQIVQREFMYPEMSSGAIYDQTTFHVGFRQGDEGKTMGLAAFGGPRLFDSLIHHLDLHDDGGFTFLSRDDYQAALDEYVTPLDPGHTISERHMDVAYAGQAIIEAIVVNAWGAALRTTGQRSLVYGGGVALNSVANEKAWRQLRPARVYIPPNPGDPGHALGCALFGAYELADWDPPRVEMAEYLGPPYLDEELQAVATTSGFPVARPDDLAEIAARIIDNGHIVGRFEGGAEFGPRALGNRSIICDPRRVGMKDYLNLRVKHREPFRPFAPTVLAEYCDEWFDIEGDSPYMLRVAPIRPDKLDLVPAVVHVDGSARLQTLERRQNPEYYDLISAFHKRTGVPLVLNTSFNLAGKPIVETPSNATECFTATEIDALMLGPYLITKRPMEEYLMTDSGALQ